MLFNALEYLRLYLDALIEIEFRNNGTIPIVLDNIGQALDGQSNNSDNSIILSLVNLEEEFTRKNQPPYRQTDAAGRVSRTNPPVALNAFLLVAANIENYGTALEAIAQVVGCFQAKRNFTVSNTGLEISESDLSFTAAEERRFRLLVELYTLTFEQMNHLWGTLGGRQVPFVLYKVRMVEIDRQLVQSNWPLITTTQLNPGLS